MTVPHEAGRQIYALPSRVGSCQLRKLSRFGATLESSNGSGFRCQRSACGDSALWQVAQASLWN